MKRSSLRFLRALPITALSVAVVITIALRLSRPPRSSPPRRPSPPIETTTTSSSPSASSSSSSSSSSSKIIDAPLRGPSPPPKADVSPGWWRGFHGGSHHTHRAGAHGPREPKIGFRITLHESAPKDLDARDAGGVDGGGDGGTAKAMLEKRSPIATQITASPDEATLYVATLSGQIIALSRADGTQRWSVSLGDRVYSAPLVHEDGTIYVGTDAKKLVALSAKGDVIFRIDTEGEADSAPVFAKDGNTIIFAAGNQVHAARRPGDLAWRFAAKGKVFTTPAITNDGLVVFGSQDHRVYGIHSSLASLGEKERLAWSVDLGADVDGAPAIADDESAVYVGTDAGEVVRLDLKGKITWRTNVGGFVRGGLSIARNGDVLCGTYGPVPRMVRVGPDGSVRGAFAIRGTGAREFGIHGGPLEDEDGVLYFGAQDDAVYALAPDGTQRWRFETGADVDAPLTMLSDGSLVIPSEDGTVTLLLP